MKKILTFLLILILVTGCQNNANEDIKEIDYDLYNGYFKSSTEYKKPASDNYMITKMSNRYDIDEVEKGLMRITSKYLDNNKYFYQNGQYLTTTDLQNLLSADYLNKTNPLTIDGINFNPTYITYIHEQNYVDKDNNLNAISIALVLNPYQTYNANTTKIHTVDEKTLYQEGVEASKKLIAFLKEKEDLKKIDIIVGLYFQTKPNSITPGSFYYEQKTNNEIGEFTKVNEKYYLFPSNELINIDQASYNSFIDIEKQIKNYDPSLSISGLGLYSNDSLKKLKLTISTSYINQNQVLAIAQNISENIISRFDKKIILEATIQNDSVVKTIITKSTNDTSCQIHLMN